mmetsp:Transcript_27523/g.84961  ORF Transcript_27523/g.84961 Transcript_27523/m.84961 type:complete len:112 (-) Transcript_27523:51-386(-)
MPSASSLIPFLLLAGTDALRAPAGGRARVVAAPTGAGGAAALARTAAALEAPRGAVVLFAGDDEAPKIDFTDEQIANAGKRDLWADWKNGIYIGSVAIGVLLPVFFFFVRP